ncbi:transcriptional regulator, AraC family [Bacillus sp. JCM 19046]|nr:transcriptional regulator, AraC family [Bacillus sp. JCM 19045]GAF18237.1 transcriptional regulator, AraC family [Bacillus sp. JCM 19046]
MDAFKTACITYMEANLNQAIEAEDVAKNSGYSLFHFHRKFMQAFQLSATDYLKRRRLAQAANLLVHSEERIIDIAFISGFDSQEAFTRAFKKIYKLPPGRYRKLLQTINQGGKRIMNATPIKHWFLAGDSPHLYEAGLDSTVVHQGKQAAYLRGMNGSKDTVFGTVMQEIKADNYLGKRVQLQAFIKTKELSDFVGLWMRVDNKTGDVLQFDNMYDRKITGDTNWNVYTIVLDVPEESAAISFGLLMTGRGTAWMDSLSFQEVSTKVPTTHNMDFQLDLADQPQNLSFEEE